MKIVIIYSPWCLSKPVRPLFIVGTQIKIFLMKSESSDPPIDSKGPYMVKVQKSTKMIEKVVHVTSVCQL